jgi:carboxypeptidase family protein
MSRLVSPSVHSQLLAVVLAALVIPAAIVAQGPNSLRGRVRDEQDRPVSYAQLQLVPGDRRVVTDQDGTFEMTGIPDGEYRILVRRIGFSPTEVTVRFPFGETLVITMQSLPRVLDSVRIRERAPSLRYTGIVIDDRDLPVVGAEVIAAGASDHGVRTDSAGHFRLLKAQKGTLVLRIRKFGYTPYFGSLTLRAEREDTIRVKRHAQDLPEAYIRAESGFGRDSFAYIELDSRMRWKLSSGGVVSREELDAYADLDLCHAILRTPLAGKMRLRPEACTGGLQCFLVDGLQPLLRPFNYFMASEVEAFEYHEKDWTGTIANRKGDWCGRVRGRDAGGLVVWLRKRQP